MWGEGWPGEAEREGIMEPYITVASSSDNGYTWTDEYPVQKLDAAGIAAIAAHDPQCDSQQGIVRVYWGEGPGECDEYTLPLSKDDIDAIRLVVDGIWPDGTPYAVESFPPPVPAQAPNPPSFDDDLEYRNNTRFNVIGQSGTIHDEPPMAAMEAITRGLAKLAPNTDEEMRRLEAAVAKAKLEAAAPRLLSALEAIVEAGRMSDQPRAEYCAEIARRAIAALQR